MTRRPVAAHPSTIRRPAWLIAVMVLTLACPVALAGEGSPKKNAPEQGQGAGYELFVKEWEPGKPSPSGGDGVGPLFNETSCVACHRLGGIGGGGRNQQNVALLTAVANPPGGAGSGLVLKGELADLHEGFRNASSIVVHRQSMIGSEVKRLADLASFAGVLTHGGLVALRKSERNTPAIFGDGLIDAIPDEVLEEAEKRAFPGFPEIKGRVSRLPDGRAGRFGWKAQTASLREFVMAACANELGLEVPGHHQPRVEPAAESRADPENLDMTQDQCDQLVDYVASLSPPVLRPIVEGWKEPPGYRVFAQVGCAICHTPQLGEVNGLYSDLLLHDMGPSLVDAATYYGSSTAPADTGDLAKAREKAQAAGTGAVAAEWRTPPLWGVADSGPFLHDGRARTLDEAIRLHGGEAATIATRYGKLDRNDRRLLLQFLLSLTVAPPVDRRNAAINAVQARARGRRQTASPE